MCQSGKFSPWRKRDVEGGKKKRFRGPKRGKKRGIDGRVARQMEEESFLPLFKGKMILFPLTLVPLKWDMN